MNKLINRDAIVKQPAFCFRKNKKDIFLMIPWENS